jgi:hypothetical protein
MATPDRDTPKRTPAQRQDEAEVKALRAVELRLAGATFQRIAEALGYADKSGAKKAYERALASLRDDLAPSIAQHRTEQLLRVETLLVGLWGKARDPNNPDQLRATDSIRRLLERQAKLLGLDAPVKVQVSDEIDEQIEALLSQMNERDNAGS